MQTMDALSGLYDQLAAAVSRRRGGFASPVTVAEIYQELVPYRSVRDSVGFAMNADYEHALLRLLSGESDLARLEPAAAADAMRRELRSPNPNVSMYREYAACDVWIAEPAAPITAAAEPVRRLEVHAAIDDEEPADGMVVATIRPEPDERADADGAPGGGSEMRNVTGPAQWRSGGDEAPPAPSTGVPRTASSTADAAGTGTSDDEVAVGQSRAGCVFCDSALPQGRQVRFCPYCGADQSKQPCSECGEVLEPEWVYCIACGSNAG